MAKYVKKPVEVEALQLLNNDESIANVIQFLFGDFSNDHILGAFISIVKMNEGIIIETLEGDLKASFGDYIIKGVKGEFYPCDEEIFNLTYEKVE